MKKIKYILTSIIFIFCLSAITPTYADDNGNNGKVNGVSVNGNGQGTNANGNNGNANGVSGNGNGQGNEGKGNGNGGSENGGAPLPINGGIVFLLAAGVVIGTVVIYKQGKKGLVNTSV